MIEEIESFAEGKEATTKHNYLAYGKNLEAFLVKRGKNLQTITPLDCKKFIYEIGKKTTGKLVMNTASIHKQFLCSIMRAVDREDVADWIRKNVREIKKENRFKVDLTIEEIFKLIEVTEDPKIKLGISLFAFNGLRAGEFLGLRFSDVKVEKKQLYLFRRQGAKYYPKNMKVGQLPKVIPLNPFCSKLYQNLKFESGKRIFDSSYKTLRKWFIRSVELAEITRKEYPITMHKLRHFFAHYWRQNKCDMQVLKEVLRHSNMAYTMLYSEPSEAEIISEFAKAFSTPQFLEVTK